MHWKGKAPTFTLLRHSLVRKFIPALTMRMIASLTDNSIYFTPRVRVLALQCRIYDIEATKKTSAEIIKKIIPNNNNNNLMSEMRVSNRCHQAGFSLANYFKMYVRGELKP